MIPVTRRERYLKQSLPIRLGGLSTDIARVSSFAEIPDIRAVETMLEESRAFVEWSAPDLLPDRVDDAARLVDIQRGLTRWYRIWNDAQHDPAQRAQLAAQARAWSDEILKMSGLLDQE